MLRSAQRTLAKTDPATYIEYVTGLEPARHHHDMLDFAIDIVDRKASGVVLAPRGSGKTTILNTGLLPWIIATRPDIRIGLLSQKAEKAEAMSGAVRAVLSESPESIEVFGNLRGTHKWSDSEWLVKGSPHYRTKDRTVVAAGADQSSGVVSKRFDLIFADDILDEINTYTIDRREKVETWFWKTLKPTQAAEGCAILVVGTRWVEGDLYQQLVEVNKWDSLLIPAITQDAAGDDVSYWPAVWPLKRLYAEREDVGWDNFACSYLNSVTNREGAIFRADWWTGNYFAELPKGRTYTFTIGVDLATSVKERADYTAGVVCARDDRNEWWVLHHSRVKTDDGHKAFVQGLWDWAAEQGYPVSRIVMESNQAQEAIVTAIQRQTPLPVVGRRTDTDKRAKARGAATFYEAHRVHHHQSLKGRELESELRSFDKGHDDLVDALCLAMDITGHSGTTLGVNAPSRPVSDGLGAILADGSVVPFADGAREMPAHLVAMLRGIPTETLTYTEAMAAMNRKQLDDHVRRALGGMLG
jgi:hypothetical protein